MTPAKAKATLRVYWPYLLYGTSESGNYGHKGRPGEVGGSAPSGGGSAPGNGNAGDTVAALTSEPAVPRLANGALDVEAWEGLSYDERSALDDGLTRADRDRWIDERNKVYAEQAKPRTPEQLAVLPDTLKAGLKPTDSYGSTRFILPDGTLLSGNTKKGRGHDSDTGEHGDIATSVGVDLHHLMQAGVIRFVKFSDGGTGGQVAAKISHEQAEHLIDSAAFVPGATLIVDLVKPGGNKVAATKAFDPERQTAESVRTWINGHYDGRIPWTEEVRVELTAQYREALELGNERSGNYGHKGRPGEVGGSGPGGNPKVEASARTIEGELAKFQSDPANSRREISAAINRVTGEIIFRNDIPYEDPEQPRAGGVDDAKYYREMDAAGDGNVLHYHTHPDDNAFSDGDWKVFAHSHVGEMRVVTSNHIYTVEKTPKWNESDWKTRYPAKMQERWNQLSDELWDSTYKDMADASPSDMVSELTRRINRTMADEFGVTFTVKPRPKDLRHDLRADDWQRHKEGLTKRFIFPNRRCRAAFLERLSAYANKVNHHPDVTTSDLGATVTYVTHSAGDTVTEKDHDGAREADRIAALPDVLSLGGEGSGNFGHAGRPGEVGGSGKGTGEAGDRSAGSHGIGHLVKSLLNEAEMRNIEGAGPAHHRYVDLEFEVEEKREGVEYAKSLLEKFDDDEDNPDRPAALERWKHAMDVLKETEKARDTQQQRGRNEIISNLANTVAKEMGIEPRFNVVHEVPKGFKVGEKQFNEAGFYNPNTNMIKLNSATIDAYNADEVKGVAAHEIMHQIQNGMEDDDDVVLTRGPDGATVATLRPSPLIAMVTPEMIKENGHSAYAKTYWDPAVVAQKGNFNAIKETMAEVARYLISPKSWDEEGHPAPNSAWVTMVKKVMADAKKSRLDRIEFDETMRKHREAHPS